jgi:hypothetical protein
MIKDDLTMIKGNHLFQFGGAYQRNYNFHMRTDNGAGTNNQVVYDITNSGIAFPSTYIPTSVPSNQQSTYANWYSQVLGLVNQPKVVYTRSGSDLHLDPIGSVAYDQSIIPTTTYFSDTWRMKKVSP